MIATLALLCGCSNSAAHQQVYGAGTARIGESLAVLGWNTSISNLRWQDDYVLVDVDAAPTDAAKPHADPHDIRFGLYGALAHPMEAVGIGSCDGVKNLVIQSLSAPGDNRLTGTVCLGPMKDRAAVRGVYLYSPTPRPPTRRRSRSGCCRPRRAIPAWWSKPPASRRGGPTAPR
jgi:hypothetical protein